MMMILGIVLLMAVVAYVAYRKGVEVGGAAVLEFQAELKEVQALMQQLRDEL